MLASFEGFVANTPALDNESSPDARSNPIDPRVHDFLERFVRQERVDGVLDGDERFESCWSVYARQLRDLGSDDVPTLGDERNLGIGITERWVVRSGNTSDVVTRRCNAP